jgi:hypothetical protein
MLRLRLHHRTRRHHLGQGIQELTACHCMPLYATALLFDTLLTHHSHSTSAAPPITHLSQILRRRRCDRGALQLASPEVKFKLETDTQDPMDVGMYQVGG